MTVSQTDLQRLARPFAANLVQRAPKGNASYVTHAHVTAKLLAVLGPYDTDIVEVIRGHAMSKRAAKDGSAPAEYRDDVVVGCILRMTAVVDDRRVTVTEAGDCEAPENWAHDGARLKNARSDAEKRCAMRLGVGLDLWSKGSYFLPAALANAAGEEPEVDTPTDAPDPDEVRSGVEEDEVVGVDRRHLLDRDEHDEPEDGPNPETGEVPDQNPNLRTALVLAIQQKIGPDDDHRHRFVEWYMGDEGDTRSSVTLLTDDGMRTMLDDLNDERWVKDVPAHVRGEGPDEAEPVDLELAERRGKIKARLDVLAAKAPALKATIRANAMSKGVKVLEADASQLTWIEGLIDEAYDSIPEED